MHATQVLYIDDGMFDLGLFRAGQKKELPASLWMAEVKVASASIEVVFNGADCISAKSHCLDLLSDHAFLH